MLRYVSKFVLEIMPSVVATVIGAYIVNHYIIPKPATNAPVAAASSTSSSKAVGAKAEIKVPAKSTMVAVDAKAAPDKAAVALSPQAEAHEHLVS